MKLWIARDSDGCLRLFKSKPKLETINDLSYWEDSFSYRGYFISLGYVDIDGDGNPIDLFPEITFGNSPQEVELKLVK